MKAAHRAFTFFLIELFDNDISETLSRYGDVLAEAIKAGKESDVNTYLSMIERYRGINAELQKDPMIFFKEWIEAMQTYEVTEE